MFRTGQWVLYKPEKAVGIFLGEVKGGLGEVHLTDEKGDTRLVIVTELFNLAPARRHHIPAARLKTSSKRVLDRLYPERK